MQEHWLTIKNSEDAQKELMSLITSIAGEEDRRVDRYKNYAQLYLDHAISGFKPGEWHENVSEEEVDVYTWNVVRSCIDTLVSKIGYNIPAPKILTSGAKEDTQDKARQYEKFLKAVFQAQSVDDKTRSILRDCLIYGVGIAKIFPREEMVHIEKIHPSRIIVDNNAFLQGTVKELYQVDYISTNKLLGLFPDKVEEIESAKEASYGPTNNSKRLVTVYEAWSISEDPKVKSRHMIITDNGVLLDEEWEFETLPFVFIRYSDDLMGFYGIGLAQQLESIQREISYIIARIQDNVDLLAVPFILKHKSSNIPDEFLANNETAKLIEWEGQVPPQVVTPAAISSQVFEYLENLFQKAFNISGLSQLSAASQKPQGLNSGVALQTYYDIETQRFAEFGRKLETFIVDLAKEISSALSTLDSVNVSFISSREEKLEQIQMNDLSTDDLTITVQPSSNLPMTPAGRMEMVSTMMKMGIISQEETRQLLDLPDLDKYQRLATAELNAFEKIFERILEKGDYTEPVVYTNLELGIRLASKYYSLGISEEVEQDRIDMLLQWINEATALLQPPELPAPPQATSPVAPPMGPAGPPQMPLPPGVFKPGTKVAPEAVPEGLPAGALPIPE